jgi:long-chain acyl-CoA synthetase
VNVSGIPDERAATDPAGACIGDDNRALTNSKFAAEVRRLAAWLHDQGIGAGDVVATMLPNRVELVTLMFAAWRVGAALTPVNPVLTAPEAAHQLTDSAARLVLVDAQSADKVADLPVARVQVADLAGAAGRTLPPPHADPAALALLIYTSGTTGQPKGVMLDHANLDSTTAMILDWFGLTSADRCLVVLPLFHVNGIMAGVVSPLAAGGSIHIAPRFDRERFWFDVEWHRITYFSAVPAIYAMLSALPEDAVPPVPDLRLAICGAAPMPAPLIAAFEARYRVPLVEGYGLSEGTVVSTANPVCGERRPGTVGLALPGQTVEVVGPDGAPLPVGESGEVVISGPNVMRGYLNRPEETARVLRGGRLFSGDVGRFDADGYLTLVDRVKDMIIRGGENIYPKEIENVLHDHPAVLEAAVVGKPDAVFGEQPVAYVTLRPGQGAEPDALLAHCTARLARFKLPREIHVEPDLPRNAVGKVAKVVLRARAAADLP